MTNSYSRNEYKNEEPIETEEAFAETFFSSILATQLIQTAYIGYKLGWYTALSQAGKSGLTASELAVKTNSSIRYAQEWLEHQAVAGWIHCTNPTSEAKNRCFVLPEAHVNVLANPDSSSYLIPIAGLQVGAIGKAIDSLVEVYKNDGGVSWDSLGDNARESMAAINRNFCLQQFPKHLESILDDAVVDKLKHHGGRIVDVGAGYAYSSIGAANMFQAARVDAYDLDAPSIDHANALIRAEGLEDRVTAYCMDAAQVLKEQNFEACDLVVALECVHDMSDPISVLRTMKKLAGDGTGTVLVVDEKVAVDFASSLGNPVDQFNYGFSCTCCLPDGKSYPNSAETGAVMRPAVLRAFAQQAGFRDIETVAVDHDFFRFYKLIA